MRKKEKILTKKQVQELGLDKVSVITADMLDGFTSIGNHAFEYHSVLTSIAIPNNITNIGNDAFFGCSSLTSVTIPNSVTNIGESAFYGCTKLASIAIPDGVTDIRGWVFMDCINLANVTIGNSVTSIGRDAFYGCIKLSSIIIPDSVTRIGGWAFLHCIGLTSITIGGKTYKKQTIADGKCKAYKGFNADMTCRGFQYKEGEIYELEDKPLLCKNGFHACLNLADIFNYYYGKIRKDIVIHEVELDGVSDERTNDSKVVAKKITIGKRIL